MSVLSVDISIRLDEFSLEVRHDFALEVVTALFGPSGSGKSTLLRVIAGLERRARGRVALRGEEWQSGDGAALVPVHRRGVGCVFQDARLFPHLSVAGNLNYAARRAPPARGNAEFDDVVQMLDLGPLLARRPASLSAGERQRVAIGRTLLTRPRLLLMDEPLAALDLKRKAEILPYIERLAATYQVPIIYVTHSIEEVAQLAAQMVVLSAGRVVAHGAVNTVLERLDLPEATGRFEAGVVLTAQVAHHDRRYQLTHLDHHGQRIVMPIVEAAPGTELRLRVRARDVALAIRSPLGISVRNILRGRVHEIAVESNTAFAEVLVDIGGARLRSRITRQALEELELRPQSPVFALVKSIAFDRRVLPLPHPEPTPTTLPSPTNPP